MRYNYNDKEKIQFSEFCCEECLTNDIIETFLTTDCEDGLDIYANAATISEILRNLLSAEIEGERFGLGMVDIDGLECDYCGDYIMTINDDMTIWVEKAFRDGELFNSFAKITFVYGDCDSKILQKLEKERRNVLIFDFEESEYDNFEDDSDFECDGDCENCDLHEEEDEFESDETVDLYDLVESMVEAILENKFTR